MPRDDSEAYHHNFDPPQKGYNKLRFLRIRFTVGGKIIRALEIIRLKKFIANLVL